MKLYIIDAFTETVFGGNPAGVVIFEKDESFLSHNTMLKIAGELRYSETAFVKPTGNKSFHIRYFTSAGEVELCGHATIASVHALMKEGLIKVGETCKVKTLAETINVYGGKDAILMDMATPKQLGLIDKEDKLIELYSVMGINYDVTQISLKNTKKLMYPGMVSTGLPDIMMPVENEEILNSINPDFDALSKLSEFYHVVGVHAFTVNTKDGKIHCRNFAPLYNINEEAATGTSNGALTYYLYKHGHIKPGVNNKIIQGEKMNRPSEIISKLIETKKGINIKIGGNAAILAIGKLT